MNYEEYLTPPQGFNYLVASHWFEGLVDVIYNSGDAEELDEIMDELCGQFQKRTPKGAVKLGPKRKKQKTPSKG